MIEVEDNVPVIMNRKVAEMIKYHANKEKIIYIIEDTEVEIIYMLKSILRDSTIYDIIFNKENESYRCSCPAFKYKKRFGKASCKHIGFLQELINSKVEIDLM